MNTARCALASPIKTDQFVCLLAGARGLLEVVAAVRDYLAAWPPEQVARVQKIDAGWAPFDDNHEPVPVHRPADLREIFAAVHGQCSALRAAGVAVAPELLELDLFLYFACTKLQELGPESDSASALRQSAGGAAVPGTALPRSYGRPA